MLSLPSMAFRLWVPVLVNKIVYYLCSNDDKKNKTYITGNALPSLGGAINCCLALITICLIVVGETCIAIHSDINRFGFHLSRCWCYVTDNPDIVGKDRGCSRATSTTGKWGKRKDRATRTRFTSHLARGMSNLAGSTRYGLSIAGDCGSPVIDCTTMLLLFVTESPIEKCRLVKS